MKILRDFITAAERVEKPIWDNPVLEARRLASIKWLGTKHLLHLANAPKKRAPGGMLARAIIKRHFEAPQR